MNLTWIQRNLTPNSVLKKLEEIERQNETLNAQLITLASSKNTVMAYHVQAMRTAPPGQSQRDAFINGVFGLLGEAGEVVDCLKKHLFQVHLLDTQKLKKELGDVMWYVVQIANASGLNLDEITRANIEKLLARYPDGFDRERSINRKAGDD